MLVRTWKVAGIALVLAIASSAVVGCSKGGSSGGGSLGAGSTAPTTSTSRTPTTTAPVASATPAPVGTHVISRGTFRALTYNVAGLPQGISSSSPVTNQPVMSPLLNAYDLVLVQEDFAYHNLLSSATKHPYQTPPLTTFTTFMPDGLNAFSNLPFSGLARTKWVTCNGYFDQANDCLADKGFFFMVVELEPGLTVDVYDLHADAGRSGGDANARITQFKQLADAVLALSKDHAVILAGDTNLKTWKDLVDEQTLQTFMKATGLKDVARLLGGQESLDRFLIKNSSNGEIEIEPKLWRYADEMIDAAGQPLSDHEGVNVDFEWRHVK